METILDGRGLARTYWLGATPVNALDGVDITIERGGRQYAFPVGSTILLSLLAGLIFWMLR